MILYQMNKNVRLEVKLTMPKIVQFIHPGVEHGPDKDQTCKKWNTDKHKRKFLLADGEYVEGEKLKQGQLMFWGEWEPPSKVEKLETNGNSLYPQWLHRPYLPNPLPTNPKLQNTDPFVFGESFKYFRCQQFRKNKPTQLASLDHGSLVLFGSHKDTFFQLDTVFVVSKCYGYSSSDRNALIDLLNNKGITEDYYQAVFKMAFSSETACSKLKTLNLCLYFGATYDNPIKGMYSFSPAKLYNGKKIGFPRIKQFKYKTYIEPKLPQGFKITEVGLDEIKDFWEKIREISRESCCVEGIKFNYDKE